MSRVEEHSNMIKNLKKLSEDGVFDSRVDATGLMNIVLEDIGRSLAVIADSMRPIGKWKKIHPQGIYECSECGGNILTDDIECYKYCHHCGIRMEV